MVGGFSRIGNSNPTGSKRPELLIPGQPKQVTTKVDRDLRTPSISILEPIEVLVTVLSSP